MASVLIVCQNCGAKNLTMRTACVNCGQKLILTDPVGHVVYAAVQERRPSEDRAHHIEVQETLELSKELRMSCPSCQTKQSLSVPVNLSTLKCDECGGDLDPLDWPGDQYDPLREKLVVGNGTAPVNHRLMQRLIATCYRHPPFASEVIEHFRRDPDRAKLQEWGIDKGLLLIHAANARVQRGHGSPWPFIILVLTFAAQMALPSVFMIVGFVGLFGALLLGSRNTRNDQHWRNYCRADSFDPSVIEDTNREKVSEIVSFCERSQPKNLFFFGGYDPFDLLGQADESWSLLVDRRKREGGKVEANAAELNLDHTYTRIVAALCASASCPEESSQRAVPSLPLSRFRVDDIVLVSGRDLKLSDHRFVTPDGIPKLEATQEDVEELRDRGDSRFRVYQRLAYYDPNRDIGMLSFLRIAHQGSFTYIESAGTRLLPLVDKLLNMFSDEPTATDLTEEDSGPAWWRKMPLPKRRAVKFVASGLAANLVSSSLALVLIAGSVDAYSSELVSPDRWPLSSIAILTAAGLLIPLFMLLFAFGGMPRLEDDWEEKRPSLLAIVLSAGLVTMSYGPEKARQLRLKRTRKAKEAREWDYSPIKRAFRVWQSRPYPRTQFEDTDLRLLRRTNDTVIQEAFLTCLEEAGIDTADFRQGAAKINNFGIINQGGLIEGGAKVENVQQTPTDLKVGPKKKRVSTRKRKEVANTP